MRNTQPWPFYTEPKRLDVRGLDVAYRRAGAGEAVVYLHGAGMTQRWLPFYEEMSKRVDFIAPEHPGFGDTDFPDWLDGFDDLVLHYADLFDALDLDRVHLIGHSFGGWIAAEIAVFFPERLRSLQLITPAGLRGTELNDTFRQEGHEALDRILNGNHELFADYLEEGDPVEALVQNYKELTTRARLAWQPRHDPKLERRLGRVSAPSQVILVDEDRVLDNTVCARYAELIPGSRTVTQSGATVPTSHLPYVQEPIALAETLTDFILQHSEA